jgi:hypothetical protein
MSARLPMVRWCVDSSAVTVSCRWPVGCVDCEPVDGDDPDERDSLCPHGAARATWRPPPRLQRPSALHERATPLAGAKARNGERGRCSRGEAARAHWQVTARAHLQAVRAHWQAARAHWQVPLPFASCFSAATARRCALCCLQSIFCGGEEEIHRQRHYHTHHQHTRREVQRQASARAFGQEAT